MLKNIKTKKSVSLVLASKSPRRIKILKDENIDFIIATPPC